MKYRKVYIIIVTLFMITRLGYLIAHPDIYSDNIFQMAIAQNFMDGHGFSFKYFSVQNDIYYVTDIKYPPLYPFVLALITFLTGNPLLSSLIIQTFVLIFLVFIWKRIFILLDPIVTNDAYFYFISLVIMSTSIFNVINTILFISLLFLSFSVYYLFRYLFANDSKKLDLILCSFFSSLIFWTHYSNFLVAFYPAVALLIIFSIIKNKIYLNHAIISLGISIILTSGVLIYNYLLTGFINYYVDNPRVWVTGFFPEHLLLTDPFFFNAFIKSSAIPIHFYLNNFGINDTLFFQIISLLTLLILALLIFKLLKKISFKSSSIFQLFVPFVVIILLTISFLAYFSLHYKELPSPGWTHIGDMRYMSAVYLSILAVFTFLLFIKVNYINQLTLQVLKIFIIGLIIISFAVNIKSTISHWNRYNYGVNNYNNKDGLQELFNSIRNEASTGKICVFINNQLIEDAFRMSQLARAASINDTQVKTIEQFPSKIIFFFLLPDKTDYRNKDFQLLEWAKKFKLREIGIVRNNISLFRVSN